MCNLILQAGNAETEASSGFRFNKGIWVSIYDSPVNDALTIREQHGAYAPSRRNQKRCVIAPTGLTNTLAHECIEDEEGKAHMRFDPAAQTGQVLRPWLYSNWWNGLPPVGQEAARDLEAKLLMGFGVRFSVDALPRTFTPSGYAHNIQAAMSKYAGTSQHPSLEYQLLRMSSTGYGRSVEDHRKPTGSNSSQKTSRQCMELRGSFIRVAVDEGSITNSISFSSLSARVLTVGQMTI